jgi:hypothetical protein
MTDMGKAAYDANIQVGEFQGMGNGKIWCIILPSNLITHDEDPDIALLANMLCTEVSVVYHSHTFLTCRGLISALCYVLVVVQASVHHSSAEVVTPSPYSTQSMAVLKRKQVKSK